MKQLNWLPLLMNKINKYIKSALRIYSFYHDLLVTEQLVPPSCLPRFRKANHLSRWVARLAFG